MATSSPRPLLRAALLGLCVGLLAGGGYLFVSAGRGLLGSVDCTGLSRDECRIERQGRAELARLQAAAGGALWLLVAAIAIARRRSE